MPGLLNDWGKPLRQSELRSLGEFAEFTVLLQRTKTLACFADCFNRFWGWFNEQFCAKLSSFTRK